MLDNLVDYALERAKETPQVGDFSGLMNWANKIGNGGLGLILVVSGLWLLVIAANDIRTALGKTGQKDWGGAMKGLAVGLIGAILLYVSVDRWKSVFKGASDGIGI